MHNGSPARDQILWSLTAPPLSTTDQLDGDREFDVVIVGGGLTGLRSAIALAEAGTSVAVLDAKEIGYGASGRSGGQCNPIWRATPDQLSRKFGREQAERLIETTLCCADDLFDDIRRYQIDCGAEQNGWFQTAHTLSAAKGLEVLSKSWREVGAEIEPVSAPELHAQVGSSAYDFALRHNKGGFVQPLSLTRGYARTAKSFGAQLYENAPAKHLERKEGKWHVTTPSGTLRAENVILTTNAYTDVLWPKLRKSMLPMVSIALATKPLDENLQSSVLPGRVTFSDTRLAIYFARYDADNRLVFGCVGSGDTVSSWGGHGRLRNGLRTVFPQLADAELECSWAGRIAVTPDMMPHMHEPAPGVIAGLGFSGRGIAMTSVMGRSLARKVLGGANEDLPFPVSPIQPMALHGLARSFVPLMAPAMSTLDKASVLHDRAKRILK